MQIKTGPGPKAGPMDPIIEELQASYREVGDLLHGIHTRTNRIIWELSHSRPNTGNIQKDASDILRCLQAVRRILELPEVH